MLLALVLLGTAASWGVHGFASQADESSRRAEFRRLANDRVGVLRSTLSTHIGAVHGVTALFHAVERVDREQFRSFANRLHSRHPGLRALEWIPVVEAQDRAAFEEARRAEGLTDFAIREVNADERMVRAGERASYLPVDYVEPLAGNERALGFDLASDALRRDAVERSRRSGAMAATAGLTLVQDRERKQGFLVLSPFVREERLLGFVLGVFRVDDVLHTALDGLDQRPIDVFVYDHTEAGSQPLLAASATEHARLSASGEERWSHGADLDVLDRRWHVECIVQAESALHRPSPWPVLVTLVGLLITAFFALFAWTREQAAAGAERERLQQRFSHDILEAQEEERRSLAQELHDGVAQDLAAVSMYAQREKENHEGDVARALERVSDGVGRGVAELRRLSYGLHPLELAEFGLVGALQELIHRTRETHPQTAVTFEHATAPSLQLGPDASLGLYRTAQESLSNALRHARASRVRIHLTNGDGRLTLTVEDDGEGFASRRPSVGFGLRSMRERASLLGGELEIASGERGTTVRISIPLA